MITGILSAGSDSDVYIRDDQKSSNVSLKSGQYLYLSVRGCWIPVIIRFSTESNSWVFQNLENINVNGQTVMLKS